jgi:uncharacterized protein
MRYALLLGALGVVFVLGASGLAHAQAVDCAKTRSALEVVICKAPDLLAQDGAVWATYRAALAKNRGQADAIAGAQRQWLADRDQLCGRPDLTALKAAACLKGIYRARLAALKAAPGSAPALAGPAVAPGQAAAIPVAPAILPEPVASLPPLPPLPALPEKAAAVLSADAVAADGPGAVLLTVKEAGRFALTAKSATGVGLQIVDMVTGPGDSAGAGGIADGRLDQLLDRGVYKLRTSGKAGAAGQAALGVAAFEEAGAASTELFYGGQAQGELGDLQQHSFWIAVGPDGAVSLEAVGRHLADLRLWRNGRDLTSVEAEFGVIEVRPAKPMLRIRIDGKIEPGVYRVTAYGGPGQRWSEGEASAPFHLRSGQPEVLSAWVEGVIGPFGSARFALPKGAAGATLRLELPEPAPVRLVQRGGDRASIAKTSRQAVASIVVGGGSNPGVVEVIGTEGQPFALRVLQAAGSLRITGSGPHLVFVDVAGEGGDELPAAAVLARLEGAKGRVIAADAPRVGPGSGWRRQFNFRGPTAFPFEVTAATAIAVRAVGPGLKASIEPLIGTMPARADGKVPQRWELEPGWYMLRLDPVGAAAGVLDLTLGPPGLVPERAAPPPPRPSIALGTPILDKAASYQVFISTAPGLVAAPAARALPAQLEDRPLTLAQEAGQALSVQVQIPGQGALAVEEATGVAVPVVLTDLKAGAKGRELTVNVPGIERRRVITLSWSDPRALVPAPVGPVPDAQLSDVIDAGTPRFFDLANGAGRSFQLDVAQGWLYRIETLGRLRTSLSLSSAFKPGLDTAQANGAGQNALVQTYVRAGTYRVAVGALDSAGRLGISALPAPLDDLSTLRPAASLRATLKAGRGVVIPLDIPADGLFKLTLDGLGRVFRARLEDAEGWPLTTPGPLDTLQYAFTAGRYRLVVLPDAVDARLVARLDAVVPPVALAGHGPHALAFDQVLRSQWREPPGRDDPRQPDVWTFGLSGPASVTLDIGDGMAGELFNADGERKSLAKLLAKNGFSGTLQAGHYVLEARSLGRNDRLDYTVALRSTELQPGQARRIRLPAQVPFALAQRRVVNLTSLGRTDLRGVLREHDGRVIERLAGRTDDWNIALSRVLPAGRYVLDLERVGAGEADRPDVTEGEEADEADAEEAGAEDTADEETAGQEDGAQETGGQETEDSSGGEQSAAANDAEGEGAADAPGGSAGADRNGSRDGRDPAVATFPAGVVELRLALPETGEAGALALAGSVTLTGPQVHHLALVKPEAESLLVITARASAELVLSLETEEGGGWRVLGSDRGLTPLLAVPVDGTVGRLRVALWSVDGGAAPMAVVARVVRDSAQQPGRVAFAPLAIEGFGTPLRVARINVPGAGLLAVEGEASTLLESSRAGRPILSAPIATLVPQGATLWLASRAAQDPDVTLAPITGAVGDLSLVIPEGGSAVVPPFAPSSGTVRLWSARTPFGQPGLDAGRGMGIAPVSTLALAGEAALRVWNASDVEEMRLRLSPHDLALKPALAETTGAALVLAPRSAQPVALPPGAKRLSLDLTAGTAAIAGWTSPDAVTVWAGGDATTRLVETASSTLLLVNTLSQPASVRLSSAPAEGLARLAAGAVLKRFFGAAGAFTLPVDARPGDRLIVTGGEGVYVSGDGRVLRGTAFLLSDGGELTLAHGPGLVAVWLERPGTPAWPTVPAVATNTPSSHRLEGMAMALGLAPTTPQLLTARTSAPVIVSLRQDGMEAAPTLFPSGAEFHRVMAGGASELMLYSPHDGPLSGTLQLTADPLIPAGEGIGDEVALAPGGSVAFAFTVDREGPVGVGLRSEPDRALARLLDAGGAVLGQGLVQMHTLSPGRYVLEARVPVDGVTTTVRPSLRGLSPPPVGPPAEVAQSYLERAGYRARTPAARVP